MNMMVKANPEVVREKLQGKVARLEGFEPPTPCFGGTCSIHLSYRRVVALRKNQLKHVSRRTLSTRPF